jgi:hypothetical protein
LEFVPSVAGGGAAATTTSLWPWEGSGGYTNDFFHSGSENVIDIAYEFFVDYFLLLPLLSSGGRGGGAKVWT